MGEEKMKLFTPVVVLLSGISAWTCDGARGPRPDYEESWAPTKAPYTTPSYTTADVRPNKEQKSHGQCPSDRCTGTCDRSDYNDQCIASWRTNCPDGCAITKVVTELTKLQRKSDSAGQEMHTTLNEIIKKIKEKETNFWPSSRLIIV